MGFEDDERIYHKTFVEDNGNNRSLPVVCISSGFRCHCIWIEFVGNL